MKIRGGKKVKNDFVFIALISVLKLKSITQNLVLPVHLEGTSWGFYKIKEVHNLRSFFFLML